MENRDVTFEIDSQEIYNVVTKSVLPEPADNEIVSHLEIGQELYSKFLKERICGEVSIWSPLEKRNIGSFKSIAKRLTTKLEGKVIDMREDKTLLRRLFIVSQRREEIDLSSLVIKFEFSAVPRSIFTCDGKLMLCTNKSVLIHEIEAIIREWGLSLMNMDIPNNCTGTESQFVEIIDVMAVVNSLNKTSEIKTCKDFSNKFNDMIMRETADCDAIRVIFDRYVSNSLKGATREKGVMEMLQNIK